MENELFQFDVPELNNRFDRVEIICNLEALAMSAFYIVGDDQMGLEEMVDFEYDSIEEYDPEKVYKESYDELIEIVDGYNFFISENKLSVPLIQLVVDEERTNLLRDSSKYQIFKVVILTNDETFHDSN